MTSHIAIKAISPNVCLSRASFKVFVYLGTVILKAMCLVDIKTKKNHISG